MSTVFKSIKQLVEALEPLPDELRQWNTFNRVVEMPDAEGLTLTERSQRLFNFAVALDAVAADDECQWTPEQRRLAANTSKMLQDQVFEIDLALGSGIVKWPLLLGIKANACAFGRCELG